MSSVLVKETTWSSAGVISAPAANGILYDSWRDKQGNIFKTVTAAPNSRLAINGITAYNLYQSVLMNSLRDVRIVIYLDGPANHNIVGVRLTDDGTGKPSDYGYYLISSQTQLSVQMSSPATSFTNLDIYSWNGLSGPVVLVWEVAQSGTNISTFRLRKCTRAAWDAVPNAVDNLGSISWGVNDNTFVHNLSGAGADQGRFQGAGWATVRYANGMEYVAFYDTSAPLTRGTLKTTYLDDQKISMQCINSGGAQPLTRRWHVTSTLPTAAAPIAKDSSTEVAGQSGYGIDTLTYNWTDSDPRWFILKAVDTGSVTTYSNLVMASRGRKPLHIIFFGDSYTEALGQPWDPTDAATEWLRSAFPLWTVTADNHGISQTSARCWVPSTDSEYNDNGLGGDVGGFITRVKTAAAAKRTSNPNARIVASYCIGINDASDNSNNPANAISPSTFAGQISRACADILATGNIDAVYIQHPPWVATQVGSLDGAAGGTGSRRALNMFNYRAAVDLLHNGTTIRVGDREGWTLFGAFPQHNMTDGGSLPGEGHPHVANTDTGTSNLPDGNRQLGNLWARAIAAGEGIIGLSPKPSVGSPFIKSIG